MSATFISSTGWTLIGPTTSQLRVLRMIGAVNTASNNKKSAKPYNPQTIHRELKIDRTSTINEPTTSAAPIATHTICNIKKWKESADKISNPTAISIPTGKNKANMRYKDIELYPYRKA